MTPRLLPVPAASVAIAISFATLALVSGCGGGGGSDSAAPTPPMNTAPVANAGADITSFKNESVTLDGSGSSDAEHDALSYTWTQISGPAVSINDAAHAQLTFAAPTSTGTLIFSLIVSDGTTSSTADTVSVTVTNRAPVAAAGDNQSVQVGAAVVLNGKGSADPDNDKLTYTWTQTSGLPVTIKDNADGTIGFTAPSSPQVLRFSLKVSDGEMSSGLSDVVVSVSYSGNNSAPTIDAGFNQTVPRGGYVYLNGFAMDPDSQPIKAQWKQISGPSVTLSNSTSAFASFTAPTTSASLVFELSATDGVLAGIPDTVTITVQNFPPALTLSVSPSLPKVAEDIVATANASDADGDAVTLSYAWTKNGIVLAGQTTNTLPARSFAKGDVIEVTATANDGSVTSTRSSTTTIQDSLPVLSATPSTAVNFGDVFSFHISATDDDGEAVPFVIHHGPNGMTVDGSGNVTWTAKLPMFDRTMDINWGIGIAANDAVLLSGTVRVTDTARKYPLRRAGIEVSALHHGLVATDLDGDGKDEMLIGSRRMLYEMGLVGASYAERWVYPFSLGDSDITAIAAADVDGDQKKEILVATHDHFYELDGINRRFVREFNPGANRYCKDLVAADLTNDGVTDLVCLSQSSSGKSSIVVFNSETGAIAWQSPDFDNATDIAVGNVDTDAAQEIILSNGYVYDGGTFNNEWASSQPFGTFLTTGDVDGDGIDEVIGCNSGQIAAWDAVHRSAKWQPNMSSFYSIYGLLAVDLDGDGTAEIVTTGSTYNSVGAYHRNITTGATEVVFDLSTTSFNSINQFAMGDVNNDGTREIVIGNGSYSQFGALGGIKIQAPQAIVWTRDLSTEPSGSLSGGQYAQTLVSGKRLVFGSNQSGYYGAPRIVSLDPSTGLYTSTSPIGTTSGSLTLDMVDYDLDSIDEAFAAVPSGPSNYIAYDVGGDVSEWASPASNSYYYSPQPVTHADLNSDGYADLIAISSDGYVSVFDVHNQTLIWKSDSLGGGMDVVVTDVDGDGTKEIIALGLSKVVIYEQAPDPVKFKERASAAFNSVPYGSNYSKDLLVADTDGDGAPEIFVLLQNYSSTGTVLKYNNALVQKATLTVPVSTQALYLESLDGGRKNIVLHVVGDTFYKVDAGLYAVDANNGAAVWRSPILGANAYSGVTLNSLQYVDTNGDGEREIAFGGFGGMYLTR